MPEAVVRVIDVYPYRLVEEGEPEFLLLRRAADVVYAGAWRMVGGKIDAGEAAWQAALRELREETGCAPARLWALPSVNTFYEWRHDRVNRRPSPPNSPPTRCSTTSTTPLRGCPLRRPPGVCVGPSSSGSSAWPRACSARACRRNW